VKRREFVALLGGAVAWPLAARPLAARAQQSAIPVIGFVNPGTAEAAARYLTAFRRGLNEAGYIEGHNVAVEYGHYDRLPGIMADLVRPPVAMIATPGSGPSARAAKAATATIPIVFGVAGDPVQLGLVASLARPNGNATGINFLSEEVAAKRLRLLHDLVPKAIRVGVLVNSANAAATENTLRDVKESAQIIGLQIEPVFKRIDDRRGGCGVCHACAEASGCLVRGS
jgi:putative ABC transport system substrate-binding protein